MNLRLNSLMIDFLIIGAEKAKVMKKLVDRIEKLLSDKNSSLDPQVCR